MAGENLGTPAGWICVAEGRGEEPFTAPDVYLRLVTQRRWSADQFAGWLAATLVQQLLPTEAHHTATTEP